MAKDAFDGAIAAHDVAVGGGHEHSDWQTVEDALQRLAFDSQLVECAITKAEGITDLILLLARAERCTDGREECFRTDGTFEQDGLAESSARLLKLPATLAFAAAGGQKDDGEIGPGLLAGEEGA